MKKTTKKLNKKEEAKQLQEFEKEYDKFITEQKKLKVKRQEEELNEQVNNFLSDVVDDGSKSKKVQANDFYSSMSDFNYVPYVDPVIDYNTQASISLDTGIKDELNDIKNLLKSMNDNLDKILHHLNGGWN